MIPRTFTVFICAHEQTP